jgi:hypothetical protein
MKNAIKNQVKERAKGCCEYCLAQSEFSSDTFSIEHIIPVVKGGTNELDNLALSCQSCNNHKFTATSSIDPASGMVVPLFHPRNQKWAEHFEWDAPCAEMIGVTPTGRATIVRLKLNRSGFVNLRTVLFNARVHPPDLD